MHKGALCRIGYQEELVGFITARICLLHECTPTDRVLMNLNSACLDGQRVLYILTLGVLEGAREKGIGSALLRLVLNEVRIHLFCCLQGHKLLLNSCCHISCMQCAIQ